MTRIKFADTSSIQSQTTLKGRREPGVRQGSFPVMGQTHLGWNWLKVKFLLKVHLSRKVLSLCAEVQALPWSITLLLIAPRCPVLPGTRCFELQPKPWQVQVMFLS